MTQVIRSSLPRAERLRRRAFVLGGLALVPARVLATTQVAPIARITPRHGYTGAAVAPVQFAPLNPAEWQKQGLLLRRDSDGSYLLMQSAGLSRPESVQLSFEMPDPAIRATTAVHDTPLGNKRVLARAGAMAPEATVELIEADASQALGLRSEHLGVLDLRLPQSGTIAVTVRLDVVRTHWVYIVTPAQTDTWVTELDGPITFARGKRDLPSGGSATTFRSDSVIALSATPRHRFILTSIRADGAAKSISLPAPGAQIGGVDPDSPTGGLFSEIFVKL